MADQQDASLLGRSESQSSVEVPTNTSRRSGPSDLKIAGFVLLACMLIAGQGLTAYFVINQKSQINSLEKTTSLLKIKMMQKPKGASQMIRMPTYSEPLLMMPLSDDDDSKKAVPMTKLEHTVTVSLEKQVKDLLKDPQLPQFNETFLANLQAMKSKMLDSEWKELESWMHHWLVFQMAQQEPPKPTPTPKSASTLQTKCQLEAAGKTRIGLYKPQCDEEGNYRPIQCWHSTGYCWCVDLNGNEIPDTMVRGKPLCGTMPAIKKMMARPSLPRLMKDDSKK